MQLHGRILLHVVLYTVFLWSYPGLLRLVDANSSLVVAGLVAYPVVLMSALAKTQFGADPSRREIGRFGLRWGVVFPVSVVLLNVALVGVLLSPDAATVPLLDPLLPDGGVLVVQGKIAQVAYSGLWTALLAGCALLWAAFRSAPTE